MGASVVAYFACAGVFARREALIAAGATALRGPLAVTATRTICQLVDPFGNVLGLDGTPDTPGGILGMSGDLARDRHG